MYSYLLSFTRTTPTVVSITTIFSAEMQWKGPTCICVKFQSILFIVFLQLCTESTPSIPLFSLTPLLLNFFGTLLCYPAKFLDPTISSVIHESCMSFSWSISAYHCTNLHLICVWKIREKRLVCCIPHCKSMDPSSGTKAISTNMGPH